ncbi:hypothetical protein CAPTEDRAFT_188352 [Capitella teleta]|uniref:G-protein coupled receptors family 1 profile domain-containing protein n=1 Tax=Capitella teleta TaxID=283909 RepID=R7VI32_CAPTE|nr:hypothetical protein CAPTEDRAFT_188352 [Capitella teleta]|eukprot:ELU18513.1 hypothetical protein CAPTEDRAFT_188352 [Capitella teleta]
MDNLTSSHVSTNNTLDDHGASLFQLIPICVLMPLSVASNLLLMTTIARCRHLHTTSNALLFFLGLVDLFFALLVLPPWAVSLWRRHLPPVLCKSVAFITMFLFLESISTIACIALDRYLRICHPMHYQQMVTKQRAAAVISLTLVQAGLLSTAPLINFGRYTFQPSSLLICSSQFAGQKGFSSVVLATTILPSFLIIVVSYWKIFRVARRQARRIADISSIAVQRPPPVLLVNPAPAQPHSRRISTSSSNSSISLPHADDDAASFASSIMRAWNDFKRTASQTGTHTRLLWRRAVGGISHSLKVNRSLKTVLTVIVCFFTCWLPYITQLTYLSFRSSHVRYSVEYVVTFLALSSSIVNPLSCALINKDYRRALLLSLGIGRTKREEEIMRRVVFALTPSRVPSEAAIRLARVMSVREPVESYHELPSA